MNAGLAYQLTPSLPFLTHWSRNPAAFRDYISVDTEKVDAQVRSGDYFVMLATMVEVLSQRPASQTPNLTGDLERIANELLYLQNYYTIIKKSPSQAYITKADSKT